jgi:Sulfotransferase domain
MPDHHVTIVSGVPRSGTSMMMQMLQAGGMELLTDAKRNADAGNPLGYFEHEDVKQGRNDLSWLKQANGKAVKVIHLLLLNLPPDQNYRVIFMLRNLDEVVISQRVMLQQQGRPTTALADETLAGVFQKQLVTVKQWLAERENFRVLFIQHKDVISHPINVAQQINLFLGANLSVAKMSVAVNPQLYRQRK